MHIKYVAHIMECAGCADNDLFDWCRSGFLLGCNKCGGYMYIGDEMCVEKLLVQPSGGKCLQYCIGSVVIN